jgi:hypothetical protein
MVSNGKEIRKIASYGKEERRKMASYGREERRKMT